MPDSRVAAIDGWFATDGEPHLIGTKCAACGTYHFPPERFACRNPSCSSQQLDDVPLSRRGTIWSYAVNHYAPPEPGPQEVPYTVAAVELATERMVVLGMVASGAAEPSVGADAEVVIEPLPDGALVWKWKPV